MTDSEFNTSSGGLNPIDLLSLPEQQREVVLWLARSGPATIDMLVTALGLPEDALKNLLAVLLENQYVIAHGEGGYKVNFQSSPHQKSSGYLDQL